MITQYRPAYYDNPRASTLSGLSTDQKPTDVENGARYKEINTGKTFCFDKENKAWYEMPQSGGGGSSVSVEPITITKNGVTTAPDGVAYSPITTDTYTQDGDKITITEDDGSKVVFTQGEAQDNVLKSVHGPGEYEISPDASYTFMRHAQVSVELTERTEQNVGLGLLDGTTGVVSFPAGFYNTSYIKLFDVGYDLQQQDTVYQSDLSKELIANGVKMAATVGQQLFTIPSWLISIGFWINNQLVSVVATLYLDAGSGKAYISGTTNTGSNKVAMELTADYATTTEEVDGNQNTVYSVSAYTLDALSLNGMDLSSMVDATTTMGIASLQYFANLNVRDGD